MSKPVSTPEEKKGSLELTTSEQRSDSKEEGTRVGVDLNNNRSGKVQNPLVGLPRDRLLSDVELFAQQHGLEDHTELLKRGALLAQDPDNFEALPDLKEDEKAAIRHELTHKWSHPFVLYLLIITCSLGAATQGWDQTGSNAANLSFPQEFGIINDEWIKGVINAAPYIGSAGLGCWLSDPINNWTGRRGCIFLTALILIATPIGSGFTQSWEALLIVRLIMGVGMGAKGATVPIFAAENSPANIRGALVMSWQLWTAFGIFAGFVANLVVADVPVIAWRLQLGSAFIPALPLAILIYFCPESARWLMKKGRYTKAFNSLRRLRHHEIQAARDLYFIHVMIQEENKIVKAENYFLRLAELFTIPRVRRATVASGVVMLGQQMCGINIIAFYSSTIFVESGFTERQALYASMGFGAINFVFAFPALFTIDSFGRRSLLLFTFPNMCWTLIVAGGGTLIGRDAPEGTRDPAKLAVVCLFLYLFTIFYSTGEGPVPFTYSAECFPLAQREQGMGWAVTVCLGFAALLSITLFKMLEVFRPWGTFWFYAGLNALAYVLILLFVPETKTLTLEELDYVFSVPHDTFIKHVFSKELPYMIQHQILRRDMPKPEPLVTFEKAVKKDQESI